jgi:hypothetical protein
MSDQSKNANRSHAARGIETQLSRASNQSEQYLKDQEALLLDQNIEGPNSVDFTKHILAGVTLLRIPTSMGKSFNVTKFVDDQAKTEETNGKTAFLMPTRTNVINAYSEAVDKERDFGYSIGGEINSRSSDSGTYFTYGKFQNLITTDPMLTKYNRIVLDEADVLKYGEEFYIPYLLFLAKARPELQIIMMSATIDVPYFQNQFKVDQDHIFEMDQTARPRPIDIHYSNTSLSDPEEMNYKVYSKKLIQTLNKKFNSENEEEQVKKGSSMLCFLPTYKAIDKMKEQITNDSVYKDVEVRVLKGNMSSEEIEAVVSTPAPKDKRVLILSTDVANRAVNWSDELNIDTVYDCGLRNAEVFNPHTQRNTVRMQFATSQQLEQSMGRAGRNFEGTDDVKGYIGIPKEKVRNAISQDNYNLDPSFMILESAKLFHKINNSKRTSLLELPNEFKPDNLASYVNEAIQNTALVESTISRLVGIGAMSESLEVTEFGQFLLKTKLPMDYGLMLYLAQQDHPEQVYDLIVLFKLLEKPHYMVEDQREYSQFLNNCKAKDDFELMTQLMNMSQSEIESIGLKYDYFESAKSEAKTTLDSIQSKGPNKSQTLLTKAQKLKLQIQKATLSQTMDSVLPQGLSHNLIRKEKTDFFHLASGRKIIISNNSITDPNGTLYLAGEIGTLPDGTLIAQNIRPTSLDQLQESEFNKWLLVEEKDEEKFDPIKGELSFNVTTRFKDIYHPEHNRDLKANDLNVLGLRKELSTDQELIYRYLAKAVYNKAETYGSLRSLRNRLDFAANVDKNFPRDSDQVLIDQFYDVISILEVKNLGQLNAEIKKEPELVDFEGPINRLYPNFETLSPTTLGDHQIHYSSSIGTDYPTQYVIVDMDNVHDLDEYMQLQRSTLPKMRALIGGKVYDYSNDLASTVNEMGNELTAQKIISSYLGFEYSLGTWAAVDYKLIAKDFKSIKAYRTITKEGVLISTDAVTGKEYRLYPRISNRANYGAEAKFEIKFDQEGYQSPEYVDYIKLQNAKQKEIEEAREYLLTTALPYLEKCKKLFVGENEYIYQDLKTKYDAELDNPTKNTSTELYYELFGESLKVYMGPAAIEAYHAALNTFKSKSEALNYSRYNFSSELLQQAQNEGKGRLVVSYLELDETPTAQAVVYLSYADAPQSYKATHDQYPLDPKNGDPILPVFVEEVVSKEQIGRYGKMLVREMFGVGKFDEEAFLDDIENKLIQEGKIIECEVIKTTNKDAILQILFNLPRELKTAVLEYLSPAQLNPNANRYFAVQRIGFASSNMQFFVFETAKPLKVNELQLITAQDFDGYQGHTKKEFRSDEEGKTSYRVELNYNCQLFTHGPKVDLVKDKKMPVNAASTNDESARLLAKLQARFKK